MNPLQNQISMLGNTMGRPVRQAFKRPQPVKLDDKALLNYMPVAGRARAVMPSEEAIKQGANAFRGMMAQRRAGMIAEAQRATIQSDMARNAQVIANRAKRVFQTSTPEARALARIQQFMAAKGKSMGNSFHF